MTLEAARETIRLTRDELYERVWSEPMATLAPQLGLSDVGLKKTCTKLRVPTPYRGYWAKKSAGQPVRRTPLPKLPASTNPASFVTAFAPAAGPKAALQAEEATGPVPIQARHEALPEHHIAVSEMLTDPHPLVAATVHLLRKTKPDGQHRLTPHGKRALALTVTMGTADRAMCIYDALIKALEERGYSVDAVADEKTTTTTVLVGEERVSIALEERVDRIERKPDIRNAKTRLPVYGPQYDFVPTGRLTLRIAHEYLHIRRSWADGAKQRVETCLNDFVVGIVAAAEALREQRMEREARQKEWKEAEERRLQAEQRRQAEASRIRALDTSLAAWRKSVVVREYVRAMRSAAQRAGMTGTDSPVAQWLDWAEGYADRIDPTRAEPTVPADPEANRWSGYYDGGQRNMSIEPRPLW
jgi:hypothetical protein